MRQEESQSMKNRIADLFLKGFWLLVAVGILYMFIDKNTRWLKPDYSQPHEYLDVTGYGSNGESLEGNDHSYSDTKLTEYQDNFFPIGKGKCTEYLEEISQDSVRLSMQAFNYFLSNEGDYNDIRVAHVKLQCVEFLGADKSCKDKLMNLALERKDRQESILIMLKSMERCERKQNIGEYRVISLGK